jgi:hypothetical protein
MFLILLLRLFPFVYEKKFSTNLAKPRINVSFIFFVILQVIHSTKSSNINSFVVKTPSAYLESVSRERVSIIGIISRNTIVADSVRHER